MLTRIRSLFHPLQSLILAYIVACTLYASFRLLWPTLSLAAQNANRFNQLVWAPPSTSPSFSQLFEHIDNTVAERTCHDSFSGSPHQDASSRECTISQDLFLSKAFSNSLQPMKIVPYLYRASGTFQSDDITVTTLISLDRFQRFVRLVERYRGPISVSVHVKNSTSHIQELLTELHSMYSSSSLMSTFVDVHLVIDSYERQFNTWRNLARLYARTDYVMMLDIDFFLSTDFRAAIKSSPAIFAKLQEGVAAFVVPAFELLDGEEGTNYDEFPENKQALIPLIRDERITMFHASWPVGHNSTDYLRFYNSKPGEVYKVTEYQPAYEPYLIFKREGPPWCEERFVGYGGNKAACIFEMYLSGISFYVLADHFIIHQNHEYAETARASERKMNRKIYSDFRQETCLRYINGYMANGFLNTTRGHHLYQECSKIEGVVRVVSKVKLALLMTGSAV